jgi:hypothetical protein
MKRREVNEKVERETKNKEMKRQRRGEEKK